VTTPHPIKRVRDMVLALFPSHRTLFSPQEEAFAPHLRGNTPLYEALTTFVNSRIDGRAQQPVPSDPIDCRASMERDYELRWLLSRLDLIYRSPVNPQAADEGEPPA
jgi:hypothetical protein